MRRQGRKRVRGVVDHQITNALFRAAVIGRQMIRISNLNPIHSGLDLPALGYQVPAFLVNAALRISGDTPLVIERHRGTIGSILDRLGRQRCRKTRMGERAESRCLQPLPVLRRPEPVRENKFAGAAEPGAPEPGPR